VRAKKKELDDLRTFPKELLRKWFKAVRELRENYKLERKQMLPCPLCEVTTGCDSPDLEPRERCLWILFTGLWCRDYAGKKGFNGIRFPDDSDYKKWRAIRLRQLRNWEEALVFILNEKEKK